MVTGVMKNSSRFLLKTQKTIVSAAAIVAVTYGVSAILGLVRARLLASHFGASEELGVFITADKIPNFIYSIIVVGMISTIFIPVFTDLLKSDRDLAWRTASSVINVNILFFLILGTLVFIFAPFFIRLLSAWKFSDGQVLLGVKLMRIMIGAQLILVISSFVTSVLQSFKYFTIPALAPVMYNIGMILGIVLLSPRFGILGPAFGVGFGSVLHLLIQLPLIRKVGFKFSAVLDFRGRGLKEIFALMPPRIVGLGLMQISSIVNNALAILISTSSVVILKFADQLQSFPVNLFGASIALAALPTLSYSADEEHRSEFKETFLTSFHQMLYLVVPASVILLVLRIPVVRLIYGASKFPWEATVQTSYTLAFFSLSIFAQSSIYLLTRSFYALKDTLTPVKVNFFTILLSISMSVVFIRVLGCGIWSIALSYSLTSVLDMLLLMYLLSKRVGGFDLERLLIPFTKISYAAVFMGISLYVPLKILDELVLDTARTINLIILTGIAGVVGIASYLWLTSLFKVEEATMFYKLIKKFNFVKSVPSEISQAIRE